MNLEKSLILLVFLVLTSKTTLAFNFTCEFCQNNIHPWLTSVTWLTWLPPDSVRIRDVLCYYESWSGGFAPEDIDTETCTHINYSFMGVNEDGSLRLDGSDDVIKRLVALKQRQPKLKILLSVGGWSEGSTPFSNIAADSAKKAKFAESTLWYMQTYQLDGLDIDWEYPGQRGGSPNDKENFIDLLWVLRNGFSASGGDYLITIATSSVPDPSSYNVPALYQVVDLFNVMTYAFHGAYEGKTGQNSPLFASSKDSQYEKENSNCAAAMANWIEASGGSADKFVMGLSFYGVGYELADSSNTGLYAPSVGSGQYGAPFYSELCQFQEGWTEVWDDEQKVPYKFQGTNWLSFDNVESIGLKTAYAKEKGLGGVMMWAIDHDDKNGQCGPKYPLIAAIKNNL